MHTSGGGRLDAPSSAESLYLWEASLREKALPAGPSGICKQHKFTVLWRICSVVFC